MEQSNFPDNFTQVIDDNIDIKRYFSLFISNWYWFTIALFISVTLAYCINRYSEKVFTVSSTLLIRDDQGGNFKNSVESVIPGGDIFKSMQNLNNEIGILKSFRLNSMVMKELRDFHTVYISIGRRGIVESPLYNSSPFRVIGDSLKHQPVYVKVGIEILSDSTYILNLYENPNEKYTMTFGEKFEKNGFDFKLEPRHFSNKIFKVGGSNRYYFYFVDPETLANEYRDKLSVTPISKDASIISLSVSGLNPDKEADYLNKLMDVYISYGLDYKIKTAEQTIRFIDEQIKIISDSLFVAERNLEKFRLDNNFIDLSREGILIQNKIEKNEDEKLGFEMQLQYLKYLLDYLNKNDTTNNNIVSPTAMGLSDPVILRGITELSEIQKSLNNLAFSMENNQLAIAYYEKRMTEVQTTLVENVKTNMKNINLLIEELNRKKSDISMEFNKLPTIERRFIEIQRNFDLNNTVYTYLLEKRAESGIARASNIPDNRIIDSASNFSSFQIRPKSKFNYTIALMLGLILPMLGIAFIDILNDKVIDKNDITRKTNVPVVGFISHSAGKGEIPVIENPGSSLAESFRSVRTALKYYIKDNEKSVIAISSTISNEGKTFISVNLAAITALLGKKVLLIGLDLRKPRINRILNIEASPGMSGYLSGNNDFNEVIKETHIKNLFYASSGLIPPNPVELIASDQMKSFMEKAKEEYDYIIIDTPPVAIVTDTLLLSSYVDLNLFIVRQRYSTRNTIELIEQLKNQGNLKKVAIILNDISLSGYYGYGIRYGYSMGYGYSYGYNYYGKGYYGRYGSTDGSKGYYVEES